MNVFYEHDSDDRLIAKKDALELNNWINHLVHTGEEVLILKDIVSKFKDQNDLKERLQDIALENKLRLGVFFRYKNSLINVHECEDMECDIYYLNKHEEYRNIYETFYESLRPLKEEVYNLILKNI
ncbi:hypothetical protein SAMN04487911_11046 [Arenibacter nanhaiticus]|uniref:Uncharacterized protein n=1 Tax=Arenibacter nanhaiticus TaxID=558155 RepID=A0A1M6G6B7_9FLAO|nr:hypothetical protein [Arenibacter nanhaiticus]SHJ05479.1 hypothetical protein SAMN04487911_11046 [Arenibacter nanhaiticus]